MNTNKLDEKIAVITGATSGLGLAAAKLFVAEGAYVFITGRRQKELEEAVGKVGRNVTGIRGDIANLADLDRFYGQVKKEKGHIDVLVANAGGGSFAPLSAITEEHFDKTFDGNVKGIAFHSAEGPAADERWRLYHPDGFVCRLERHGRQRLRRQQSRHSVLRSRLDHRPQGA
jgi:NAD(P)-dependent dehydrogenase (short-subunit alcohol dehydrogenase family)